MMPAVWEVQALLDEAEEKLERKSRRVERLQRERNELCDEADRYREIVEQMADTLRAVLVVVDQDEPYPWQGGALKNQIREDITAYELLGLDAAASDDAPPDSAARIAPTEPS